jgi:hypothetical protein
MDPFSIVVLPEVCEFSLKVLSIPKDVVIKVFATNGSVFKGDLMLHQAIWLE